MQRDFGLHFVGLKNCQEAFAMYDPTVREVSLSTMVEKLDITSLNTLPTICLHLKMSVEQLSGL